MTRRRPLVVMSALVLGTLLAIRLPDTGLTQAKPEGELRWALYVALSPQWFDPGEVVGQITPFWVLYAIHDALVKPMPGSVMTPSLAESWTVSPDQETYEFELREGVKFHNGDPFTAEDVKFSFQRAKGQIQWLVHERVRLSPIYEYIWPSGIGSRVEQPALMLINPYPWSAPLEEVRLKKL